MILVGVDKYSMQQLLGISLILAALGAVLWVHMHKRRQRSLFASPGTEALAESRDSLEEGQEAEHVGPHKDRKVVG